MAIKRYFANKDNTITATTKTNPKTNPNIVPLDLFILK
mgnify:CR=1 FL=1